MSVVENKRTPNKLEALVKANDLAVYTVNILQNKKIFKPEVDQEIISRIKGCVYDIYAYGHEANSIFAKDNQSAWKERYALQRKIIHLCNRLDAYVNLAKRIYHLRSKKFKTWVNKLNKTRALLKAWHDEDIQRYGKL